MFQLHILPERKLIIIKYSGEVNARQIQQVFARAVKEQPERVGFKILSITGNARFNLSSDETAQLMDRVTAYQLVGSKSAIVVDDMHTFGLSRMWASHSEDRLPYDIQIFYSLEEACGWLEIDQAVVDGALREKG